MTFQAPRELIHAYLDDFLSDDEFDRLASQLTTDPELVDEFVAIAALHDHLQNDWCPITAVSPAQTRSPKARPDRRLVSLAFAAAMLLAVGTVVWQAFGPSPASAALVQLQRIVAVSLQSADRTYSITAEDDAATTEPGKPEIDGARLFVRMPNSYVLVRQYDDGTVFTTGCDGLQSWSIPPQGRVRVSPNVERFRGAVPGEQHAIAFLADIRDLEPFTRLYEVETGSPNEQGLSCLRATRKPGQRGGPKTVDIYYDAATAVIERMTLDRLPQAKGGPRRLTMELISEEPLAKDFFRHESHHDTDREVIEE